MNATADDLAAQPPRSGDAGQSRDGSFHGRAAELTALRRALTGPRTVACLHGPGGIGKSTLLHRFAAEVRESGRPVVVLRPGQAGSPPPDGTREAPLVLVDDLERADQPEQWVRHTVLPAFPAGTLVVVATRQPPSLDWCTELGWSDRVLALPLTPFPPDEAALILRAHGVPAARLDDVARACGGNPLALRAAARILAAAPDRVSDEDLHRELALATAARLVGSYPSAAHRQALEVCALAATTNENLLRAVLPAGDVEALFTWLRGLPFVVAGPRGLHPSDVVRHVVESELRWRDPDQFAALNDSLAGHLIERARAAAGDAVAPAVADVLFVRRTARPGPAQPGGTDLEEEPYRAADRDEVIELARRVQGAGSARLAGFWLDRQPAGFRVIRHRGEPRIVAFTGQWELSRPSAEESAADPVVEAAWRHVQRSAPLRPGELLNLVRFLVDAECPARPTDVTALIQGRVATPLIRDDRIAWSVVACPDRDPWPARLAGTHLRADVPPVVLDERPYALLVACRDPHGDTDRQARTTWDRAGFEQEVRRTLRTWRRPDQFADSGLVHSRMVAEAGHDDAVAGLRQTLTAALDTLADDPRQAKFHRVLVATFLQGVPTQEAAAERLSLPLSTYRRHLGRGLDELCALLWKVENHGLRLLTGITPGPAGPRAAYRRNDLFPSAE